MTNGLNYYPHAVHCWGLSKQKHVLSVCPPVTHRCFQALLRWKFNFDAPRERGRMTSNDHEDRYTARKCSAWAKPLLLGYLCVEPHIGWLLRRSDLLQKPGMHVIQEKMREWMHVRNSTYNRHVKNMPSRHVISASPALMVRKQKNGCLQQQARLVHDLVRSPAQVLPTVGEAGPSSIISIDLFAGGHFFQAAATAQLMGAFCFVPEPILRPSSKNTGKGGSRHTTYRKSWSLVEFVHFFNSWGVETITPPKTRINHGVTICRHEAVRENHRSDNTYWFTVPVFFWGGGVTPNPTFWLL